MSMRTPSNIVYNLLSHCLYSDYATRPVVGSSAVRYMQWITTYDPLFMYGMTSSMWTTTDKKFSIIATTWSHNSKKSASTGVYSCLREHPQWSIIKVLDFTPNDSAHGWISVACSRLILDSRVEVAILNFAERATSQSSSRMDNAVMLTLLEAVSPFSMVSFLVRFMVWDLWKVWKCESELCSFIDLQWVTCWTISWPDAVTKHLIVVDTQFFFCRFKELTY